MLRGHVALYMACSLAQLLPVAAMLSKTNGLPDGVFAEKNVEEEHFESWEEKARQVLQEQKERSRSVFYVIDTHSEAGELRSGLRSSWLRWAVSLGHQYKFFLFPSLNDPWGGNMTAAIRNEARYFNDMVFIMPEDMPWLADGYRVLASEKARQGNLIRAAMQWVVRETDAKTIVKVDHDGFICPQHLECQRASLPWSKLFWGSFWDQGKRWCRADQNFQVFSRDVAEKAVDVFDSTPGWNISASWARGNWDRLARYLWMKGDLHFVDDKEHLESQQFWHTSHHFQHYEADLKPDFQSFCRSYVFGHIWPSKDINVMHKLFDVQDQQKMTPCKESMHAGSARQGFTSKLVTTKLPPCAQSLLIDVGAHCTTWDTC